MFDSKINYNRSLTHYNLQQWYEMVYTSCGFFAPQSPNHVWKHCEHVIDENRSCCFNSVVTDHLWWTKPTILLWQKEEISVLLDLVRVCCCWGRDGPQTKIIFSWFVCLKKEMLEKICDLWKMSPIFTSVTPGLTELLMVWSLSRVNRLGTCCWSSKEEWQG